MSTVEFEKILKFKNNKFYFSVDFGINPLTGKRMQTTRTRKTLEEIKIAYDDLCKQYKVSKKIKKTKMDFITLCELHIKERKNKNLSFNTIKGEVSKIKTHIIPYFKKSVIKNLTREHVLNFREELLEKQLENDISNNTINKIMLCLKQIFDTALEYNLIIETPYTRINQLKVEKTVMDFYTPREYKLFADYLKEHAHFYYQAICAFLYLTGARFSEVLACRWEQIEEYSAVWIIKDTLAYDDGKYFLTDVKTSASRRKIALNKNLFDMLKKLKKYNKSDFVFSFADYYPQKNIIAKQIRKYIKEANIKDMRIHDFRHSHAALLIDMREQDFLIKERMGHSSIKVTYDIYGHLFPTRQQELANKLNDLF